MQWLTVLYDGMCLIHQVKLKCLYVDANVVKRIDFRFHCLMGMKKDFKCLIIGGWLHRSLTDYTEVNTVVLKYGSELIQRKEYIHECFDCSKISNCFLIGSITEKVTEISLKFLCFSMKLKILMKFHCIFCDKSSTSRIPLKFQWAFNEHCERIISCCSDSFTILSLWVLGLAISHINESNCKLMSPEHYFSWQVCNTIASWNSLK